MLSFFLFLFTLQLDFKIFFKGESAPDTGSTCASVDLSGKTNAKQGPMVDYNAYKDFHDREFEAHVLASFMTFAGMNLIEGKIFIFTVLWTTEKCIN